MKMKEEHKMCEKGEQPRLYKIGMFAGMNHVTVKTLRYYDEQNLLKPLQVDNENGYRYYGAGQVAELHRIMALRGMGFSIEDIRSIISGVEEKKLLQAKKQEILREIAAFTAKLAAVESYLNKADAALSEPVLIKKLPEVTVCTMTHSIESYDALFELMPRMGEEMERLGCSCAEPDYCFMHYLDSWDKENDVSVEICEAVTEKKQDSDKVTFKVFPEVEAACVFHKGSYDTMYKSYEIIMNYLEENGYEICGSIRESYIDGIWNQDSETEWLTEIQIPVKRR